MDDRDQPEANVVSLRRKGEPVEAERKQLADTIFADEDDVGTFSRGNLVPPARHPLQEDSKPAADPFFDRVREDHGREEATIGAPATEADGTAVFFDQIGSQSAADRNARLH